MVARLVEVEGCHIISQKECVGNAPLEWVARVVEILVRTVQYHTTGTVHGGGDFTSDKPHESG